MGIATLYDLLGVDVDASAAEIRAAYRRAAREHHPDRHGDRAAARMAEVNGAWEVLGDPRRRAEYDSALALGAHRVGGSAAGAGQQPTSAPAGYAEPAFNPLARYQTPPRFPWRFMGVLFLLGLAFVVLGVVTASDPKPPVIDNVLEGGSCVVIEVNGDAAERLCTDPHDGVVTAFITDGTACPDGSEPHRDRQGMGTACIVRG